MSVEHVREHLAAARRAGQCFDDAWADATADLPTGSPRRRDERAAVLWARPAFQRAYTGQAPARGERVLARLAAVEPDTDTIMRALPGDAVETGEIVA